MRRRAFALLLALAVLGASGVASATDTADEGVCDAEGGCGGSAGQGGGGPGNDGGSAGTGEIVDAKGDCWKRALEGGCGPNGADEAALMATECIASCARVASRAERKRTALPRARLALPSDPHRLAPEFSKRNPPPGHLRPLFEAPSRLGSVEEVGPWSYPTAAEFHRLFAPTLDAQKRSHPCRAAIVERCGPKAKKGSAASKAKRAKCYERHKRELAWWCGDASRGTPLIFRGLGRSMPAFERWASRDAMRAKHSSVALRGIEIGPPRETRGHEMGQMSVGEFLDAIVNDTADRAHYDVDPLPLLMLRDVHLPHVARCGGATDGAMKIHLWMSGGGTESVIHNDQYDNINCVFAGSKRFYIADASFSPVITDRRCGWADAGAEIRAAGTSLRGLTDVEVRQRFGYGQYARGVNVSAVDLVKFPCWSKIPWREAVVEAGDCLFIPQWHYHHVASHTGPGGLSVATNVWWKRTAAFDEARGFGCRDDGSDPVTMAAVHKRGQLNPGMY